MLLKMRAPSPSSDLYELDHADFQPPDGLTFVGQDGGRDFDNGVVSSRRKGKGKEVAKRPPAPGSDSDSDLDIPISAMRPPQKKRRVENNVGDEPRSVVEDHISMSGASPAHKLVNNAKGRGKGKQREQSADSVSATPKGRKKGGPRKKLDNLPPQTQESLGIGSAAPSVSGDITPVGSRPPSPTLTSISATVYELDEAIPPLKKARKVDDAAMMKRVRNLEEAQRKVWMNIARRDVAKVCAELNTLNLILIHRTIGVQISRHRLPNPPWTDEQACDTVVHPGASAFPEDREGDKGRPGKV